MQNRGSGCRAILSRRLPSPGAADVSSSREIPKDNSGLRGPQVLISSLSSSCPSLYSAPAGCTLTLLQKKQPLRFFPAQVFAREAVSMAAPRVQMLREYEWLSTHTRDIPELQPPIDNRYGGIRNMREISQTIGAGITGKFAEKESREIFFPNNPSENYRMVDILQNSDTYTH